MTDGSWVLGFLSGVGYINGDYDPLRGLDANAVEAWLDHYCQAHPSEKLSEAAAAFIAEHPH
jgi:hypothetical protein